MNNLDDEDTIFAIRRSTQDKLTYKNILAQSISRCNFSKGTTRFRSDVEALASDIRFNVSGYNLRTELDEIQKKLIIERKQFIDSQEKQLGRKIFFHAFQAKLRIKVHEWYWNTYFEYILQLLASHNLLFDTEKRIPVIQDKRRYDEEDD